MNEEFKVGDIIVRSKNDDVHKRIGIIEKIFRSSVKLGKTTNGKRIAWQNGLWDFGYFRHADNIEVEEYENALKEE